MMTSSSHSQQHPAQDHRPRRAPVLEALVLAAGLALTGCSHSGAPPNAATSPTAAPATSTAVPTSAAPTPSPSPVYKPATANGPARNVPVPVLPAKAKEFSKAGLEAFARYWYSTLGYAFETGDARPMMDITDPGCASCERVKNSVADWYKSGGWVTGGRMIVHSSTSTFYETAEGNYQAVVLIQQTAVSYYQPDKSLDTALPQKKARADIVVAVYEAAHWKALTAEHLTKD